MTTTPIPGADSQLTIEQIACMGFDAFRILQGMQPKTYSIQQICAALAAGAPVQQSEPSIPQPVWEFIAMLALQSGGMLSGNRVSRRARELLDGCVPFDAAAPAGAVARPDLSRLACWSYNPKRGLFRHPEGNMFMIEEVEALLSQAPQTTGETK
jgi:hypothetical protein